MDETPLHVRTRVLTSALHSAFSKPMPSGRQGRFASDIKRQLDELQAAIASSKNAADHKVVHSVIVGSQLLTLLTRCLYEAPRAAIQAARQLAKPFPACVAPTALRTALLILEQSLYQLDRRHTELVLQEVRRVECCIASLAVIRCLGLIACHLDVLQGLSLLVCRADQSDLGG